MTPDTDDFRQALFDASISAPAGLTDGHERPAGRRFDVYRNNVAVSLTEALRDGFPVLAKLLGDENMKGLAGAYWRAHPPSSPLMMFFGEALPEFIESSPQLAHLGYLPDIARMELALRHVYHEADSDPVDPGLLVQLSEQDMLALRVALAPALRLLRSDWPVYDIWLYNTQDGAPKPAPGGQDVLITRANYDPTPHLLPDGGFAFVTALSQGRTLRHAYERASENNPEFDPAECLTLLLQGQSITAFVNEGVRP